MRLNFYENKIKTCISLFVITFITSFIFLYCLRLDVHAMELDSYPLPIVNTWYHLDDSVQQAYLTALNSYINNSLPSYGRGNFNSYMVTVVDYSSNLFTVRCLCRPKVSYNTSGDWFNGDNYISFNCRGVNWGGYITCTYNSDNNSFGGWSHNLDYDGNVSMGSLYSYNALDRSSSSGLQSNVLSYPIYSTDDILDSNGVVIFSNDFEYPPDFSGHSIGGNGTGSFIHSDENPSTITGFDFDVNLYYDDSGITSRVDTLNDNVNGLGDKIDTTNVHLANIWGAISDYFSAPDPDEISETLDNYPVISDLTSTVNDTKSTVNNIFDFQHIQPKTADNVDFDYNFKWKVYVPQLHAFQTRTTTIHIVFSWFESIRTPVTLVLTIFLVLGFLVYVFRQIPNLINGVGAGASAGQSIADMNNNNSSGKGNGKK